VPPQEPDQQKQSNQEPGTQAATDAQALIGNEEHDDDPTRTPMERWMAKTPSASVGNLDLWLMNNTLKELFSPTHPHTHTQGGGQCLMPSLCMGRRAFCIVCGATLRQAMLTWAAVAHQQAQASQAPVAEAEDAPAAGTTHTHTHTPGTTHTHIHTLTSAPELTQIDNHSLTQLPRITDRATIAVSEPTSLSGGLGALKPSITIDHLLPSTRHVGYAHWRRVSTTVRIPHMHWRLDAGTVAHSAALFYPLTHLWSRSRRRQASRCRHCCAQCGFVLSLNPPLVTVSTPAGVSTPALLCTVRLCFIP
jgi:hypothetical protein